MQERGIVDPDQGSTCSNWVANMSQLRNLLGLGIAHDRDYQTGILWVPFCFRPWCGQALVGAAIPNERLGW